MFVDVCIFWDADYVDTACEVDLEMAEMCVRFLILGNPTKAAFRSSSARPGWADVLSVCAVLDR